MKTPAALPGGDAGAAKETCWRPCGGAPDQPFCFLWFALAAGRRCPALPPGRLEYPCIEEIFENSGCFHAAAAKSSPAFEHTSPNGWGYGAIWFTRNLRIFLRTSVRLPHRGDKGALQIGGWVILMIREPPNFENALGLRAFGWWLERARPERPKRWLCRSPA